jgi:hypothetical protein
MGGGRPDGHKISRRRCYYLSFHQALLQGCRLCLLQSTVHCLKLSSTEQKHQQLYFPSSTGRRGFCQLPQPSPLCPTPRNFDIPSTHTAFDYDDRTTSASPDRNTHHSSSIDPVRPSRSCYYPRELGPLRRNCRCCCCLITTSKHAAAETVRGGVRAGVKVR